MAGISQFQWAPHVNLDSRFDAIRKAREWAKSLDSPTLSVKRLHKPLAPRYPIEDLLSLVNPDIRKPFDMSEVVLRLVDDSRAAHFKPTYGKNLLTCWADIHGMTPLRWRAF